MTLLGVLGALALGWLVGALLGFLLIPIYTYRLEWSLRRRGHAVGRGARPAEWSPEDQDLIQRESQQVGKDAVLAGQSVAMALALTYYTDAIARTYPWYAWAIPFTILVLAGKGRIEFALIFLAVQFGLGWLLTVR